MDYAKINFQVMTDTKRQYESVEELRDAVRYSIEHQYMVAQEDNIDQPIVEKSRTKYVCSEKRSFEAAKSYKGKKTAVLNYANNHAIGGAPFHAGAQEESLCRCSTLYPCLQAMRKPFYEKHIHQFESREIGVLGNDDLIYTPDVVVFKTDERTDPIYPKMMERSEWYKVDVITSAAPEIKNLPHRPANYEGIITSRIKKILDVAAKEKVEVLILGAWGCGAFGNPAGVVARVFHKLLKNYDFETVEFAMSQKETIFAKEFATSGFGTIKDQITELLKSTQRENIDNLIDWLNNNNFFKAPASVNYHNAVEGGLAKHSLDVYNEAMKLNESYHLPKNSVILCSLLHDICKSDQYYIDQKGMPKRDEEKKKKGHGKRSMYIIIRGCQVPLNYDEAMAIWWHMGENEESKRFHEQEYTDSLKIKLCELIKSADHNATHH